MVYSVFQCIFNTSYFAILRLFKKECFFIFLFFISTVLMFFRDVLTTPSGVGPRKQGAYDGHDAARALLGLTAQLEGGTRNHFYIFFFARSLKNA